MKENRFGFMVKTLRNKEKLTGAELAKKLGFIDRSTISNIENKGRGTTFDNLLKIADFFDVTLDYIVYGDDTNLEAVKKIKQLEKKITELEDQLKDKEHIINLQGKSLVLMEEKLEYGKKT